MSGRTAARLEQTPYLAYLEGLRGVAALYVVIFHIRQRIDPAYLIAWSASSLLPGNGFYLLYGHTAVAIFIVISGYVLSIPLARRSVFAVDFVAFMKRRFRRLLPAYYAALGLSLPFYFIALREQNTRTGVLHFSLQLLAHVLLIHNFFRVTVYGISVPLWSIATEMQIYVVFCLLLLPLQKRFGLLIALLVAFVLGLLPTAYAELRHVYTYSLEEASFWLLGLFAAGSTAAWISYGPEKFDRYRRLPWKLFSILGIASFVALIVPDYGSTAEHPNPLQDVTVGVAIACGFVAIAIDQRAGRRSIVAAIFSWRPFVLLGTFSYSLYLIHGAIVEAFTRWSLRFAPFERLALDGALLIALLPAAYLFARFFEFPFVSAFRRKNDEIAMSAHPDGSVPAAAGS